MNIKRAIGWALAWILYVIGDLVSRLMGSKERRSDGAVYAIYSSLMHWSLSVQDWAGASSPWSKT